MRPDKLILAALARQMYEDIRFNAANAPTMAVDEDTTRLFNILLRQSREALPGMSVLEAFMDMTPRTIKFKDALIVSGQLNTILQYLTGGVTTASGATAASSGRSEPNSEVIPMGTRGSSSMMPKMRKPMRSPETGVSISGETSTARVATASSEFEEELYGPNPPKRLNADGTVPFSLDE